MNATLRFGTVFCLASVLAACASATVPGDGAAADTATDTQPDMQPDSAPSPCAPGTCRLSASSMGPCLPPGGPIGLPDGGGLSGCCGCGDDGVCSRYCICASPDTPIATPEGERPIASIAVGDRVLSMHRGSLVAVVVREVRRAEVHKHRVVRVVLRDGRVLELSPGHPTADGRTFGELRAGDWLGGRAVRSAELVPYTHDATYDLLPDSDTGTYVAAGALIGSTLAPMVRRDEGALCAAPTAPR